MLIEIIDNIEQNPINKKTSPYMTKYEKTTIIGTRAHQLSDNAPPMINIGKETDPIKIALEELKQKKLPITIRRHLPDGSYEDWMTSELIDFNK